MSRRKRNSDSEDLQSFLNNFHKEIEDGSSEAKNAKDKESVVGVDAEKEEEDEEDDDDKYFIDDEGNCYIKTTPKKQHKFKSKLKPAVASTPAAITVRSAAKSSSPNASKGLYGLANVKNLNET